MKTISLPAGTEHVQFDELAHLIAAALHPFDDDPTEGEMMAYAGARINLDVELLQAVQAVTLPVKDPLTLGPHTFPVGNALQNARVLVSDIQAFLAGRCNVAVEPPRQATPSAAPEKPVQRSAAQDAAIMDAIRTAGHDPQALPVNARGKRGVKAAIRAKLEGVSPLFPSGGTTFEKAWERLRKQGDIADTA